MWVGVVVPLLTRENEPLFPRRFVLVRPVKEPEFTIRNSSKAKTGKKTKDNCIVLFVNSSELKLT